MPSLLPGHEYDIFISYRHNDNRSGWVTEFVKALQEELAATIKEPLSVYYDTNPHDGLLETHNVDKSLEGKLKCLIFIPILSQTYCDTKSFAWQHEFCAFNKLAQADELGRDIKLSNGNVTSRILPIKIHDLDHEDQSTIEKEIGGVLRAIEFIYKEPGVNRPLNSSDDKNDNQNKTDYRNQVNKVANAIKEITASIKPSNKSFAEKVEDTIVHPTKSTRKLGAIVSILVFLLALIAYFVYPEFIPARSPVEIEKSIAVLPFVNMSGDAGQEYFSDGISEEIINRLAQIKELKVIGRSSSFQFKGQNPDLRRVGETLQVSTVLEGSIRKSGNRVRVTAQLIRVDDGSHLWSQNFNSQLDDIFDVQDEIANAITDQMKISFGLTRRTSVKPEIYDLYLRARSLLSQRGPGVELSVKIFEQLLELDSTYQPAWAGLAQAWNILPIYTSIDTLKNNYKIAASNTKRIIEKALALNPKDPEALASKATFLRGQREWNESMKYYEMAISIDDKSPSILEDYAQFLLQVGYVKNAMPYAQRMIDIEPLTPIYLLVYANALRANGFYQESIQSFKKALQIDPNFWIITRELAWTYLAHNQIDSALYVINTHNVPTEFQSNFLLQMKALEQNNTEFDFDIPDRVYFAMVKLGKVDKIFEIMIHSFIEENFEGVSPVYDRQFLISNNETYMSDPRMKQVIRNYGLVEFWQEHGWPDQCKPMGNGDFVCR